MQNKKQSEDNLGIFFTVFQNVVVVVDNYIKWLYINKNFKEVKVQGEAVKNRK